jgi:hypothetical protein
VGNCPLNLKNMKHLIIILALLPITTKAQQIGIGYGLNRSQDFITIDAIKVFENNIGYDVSVRINKSVSPQFTLGYTFNWLSLRAGWQYQIGEQNYSSGLLKARGKINRFYVQWTSAKHIQIKGWEHTAGIGVYLNLQ